MGGGGGRLQKDEDDAPPGSRKLYDWVVLVYFELVHLFRVHGNFVFHQGSSTAGFGFIETNSSPSLPGLIVLYCNSSGFCGEENFS